jgi:hypothetical protein
MHLKHHFILMPLMCLIFCFNNVAWAINLDCIKEGISRVLRKREVKPSQLSQDRSSSPTPLPGRDYIAVEHRYDRGFSKPHGHNSNLGGHMMVEFKLEGESEFKLISGRVVKEYPAGVELINDADGKLISIHDGDGAIKGASVLADNSPWVKMSKNLDDLPDDNTPLESRPLAVVTFRDYRKNNGYIIGKVTKGTDPRGESLLKVVDADGNSHILNNDYVDIDMIAPTNTSKWIDQKKIPSNPNINLIDLNSKQRHELVAQLIQTEKFYDDPKLFSFFSKHPKEASRLIDRWYGEEIREAMTLVSKSLGPEYLPLLLDPGIANRVIKFVSFSSVHLAKNPGMNLADLRKAFSKKLGNRKLKRGMLLTPDEAANMQKNGIASPGLRNKKKTSIALYETLDPNQRRSEKGYARSPHDEMAARLTDFDDSSQNQFLSATIYDDIAKSVAYHDSIGSSNEGRKLYVFEIEVPEISVIEKKGLFDPDTVSRMNDRVIVVEGKGTYDMRDLGVEVFIPFKIQPEQIKQVNQIKETPSGYRWERKKSKE